MRKSCFLFLGLLFSLSPLFSQLSQNMNLLANWDDNTLPSRSGVYYNDIWGYAANGREYAILGTAVGTIFLDVTDPAQLFEIARFNGGYPNSLWRDFKTYRQYAYGVADETRSNQRSTLQIFDMSFLPFFVLKAYDSSTFFETAHNIFIDEPNGKLYAVGTNTRGNGVVVLDIGTNPTTPTQLASVALPGGYVHDIYVRNDTAYCSHGWNGLYIYDMRNPASPQTIGAFTSYSYQGYNHSSWLSEDGNYLVFADETHNRPLRILDVSDFNNISLVSTFKSNLLAPAVTNSIAHNPFIKGDSVYISYYHEGIQVYNISNPNNPTRSSFYDTEPSNTNYAGYRGCWGLYPFLPSGNLIASDVSNGLFVTEMVPVVLSLNQPELEAEGLAEGVRLRWHDPEQASWVRYVLERAAAGESFQPILEQQVDRVGQRYEHWDSAPLAGEATYRLVGYDPDGNPSYSPEVQVFFQYAENEVSLSPNPVAASRELKVDFRRKSPGTVYLRIFALDGRLMREQAFHLQVGHQQYQLSLAGLAAGMYLAWLTDEQGQQSFSLQLK
jgi:choice-of-anchor B domain-containing protein